MPLPTRADFIEANKTRSLNIEKPIRVQYNDEKFVFEKGKLVEYELDVPMLDESSDWNNPRKEFK